ncbi:hypothetical protein D1AOALGA4SA_664 [Olavius algarvensis Delta 1 endosymbiont]|nr:hypothetical protein D1AOALGA4SA_664 [Olavius algarvensis Delta 1 endosymbiont]
MGAVFNRDLPDPVIHINVSSSAASGLKNGQSDQIKNFRI